MRKISSTIIAIIVIISALIVNSNAAHKSADQKAWEKLEEVVAEYLEEFKGEDVPEEQRILDYKFTGYSTRGAYQWGDVPTKYTADFSVTPANADNTIWLPRRNLLYVDFNYENGEFTVEKIADKPENWDKFLERFEEYENNKEIQITTIEAQDGEKYKSAEVQKMSNYIYLIGGTVLIIGIITFIILIKRRKK